MSFLCTVIANAVDYARRKNRPGEYLINLAVPALMMPAILVGTVLPFILPALKMATLVSGIINNGALITAIMYAAKSAALSQDSTKHVYYNQRYDHRRSTSSF